MTEELERPTKEPEAQPDLALDNIEPHLFDLTKMLVDYHRSALEIRSQGFFEDIPFDPPEIRELVNLLQWCGDGFNVIDHAAHTYSLATIIKESAKEVKSLIEQVREVGATEQLAYEVNYVNAQLTAADMLLGLISND